MSNLCGQPCPRTLTTPSRKHLKSPAGVRELHSDHAHTLPCDKLFLTCGVTSSKMWLRSATNQPPHKPRDLLGPCFRWFPGIPDSLLSMVRKLNPGTDKGWPFLQKDLVYVNEGCAPDLSQVRKASHYKEPRK